MCVCVYQVETGARARGRWGGEGQGKCLEQCFPLLFKFLNISKFLTELILIETLINKGFPGDSDSKESPAMQEAWV